MGAERREVTINGLLRYEQCPRKYQLRDVLGRPSGDTFALRYGRVLHEVAEWLQGRALGTWRRGRRAGERPELACCGPALSRVIAEFWRRWRAAEHARPLPEPASSAQATRQRRDLENLPAMLGMLSDHLLQDPIVVVGEQFGRARTRWTGSPGLRVTEQAVLSGKMDRIVEREGALVVEDLSTSRRCPDVLTLPFDLHLNLWALAAEEFIGDPDALAIYDLRRGEVVQVPYDRAVAHHLMDEIVAPLAVLIEQGHFPKTPHGGWGCRYCGCFGPCWAEPPLSLTTALAQGASGPQSAGRSGGSPARRRQAV